MPTLLIVDDDDAIRGMLFDLLSDKYECNTASMAEEALQYIEIEKYDPKDVDKDYNEGSTDEKYWIKAWFKYDEHYYKGFGFYLAYKNDKWVVRYNPSTSTIRNLNSE